MIDSFRRRVVRFDLFYGLRICLTPASPATTGELTEVNDPVQSIQINDGGRHMSVLRRILFAVLCVTLLSMPLMAQTTTGAINGRVGDSSDALIPGVTITLTSPAIQGSRTTVTDEAGSYRFILLPPGT